MNSSGHDWHAGGDVDISAVIVNWNTKDLLDDCLRSLRDHPPTGRSMEVLVVDNGSTDGSAELVREQWPTVALAVNERNEGYIRANNRAITQSRGRYLLLINADACAEPGTVDRLLTRLESRPRAAVVGPRLVYGDGSWQRWTAGRAPDLLGVAAFFLFGERLSGALARRSYFLAGDVTEAFRPDWVSSACMLVRRSALSEVGLMDERYFCYMDDVDLCQRIRDAGWEVWYEPAAEVVHLMGQSTRRQTGAPAPAAIRNFNDYFRRRNGSVAGGLVRLVQVAGYGARAVVYLARALLRSQPADSRRCREHVRSARVALQRGHV